MRVLGFEGPSIRVGLLGFRVEGSVCLGLGFIGFSLGLGCRVSLFGFRV